MECILTVYLTCKEPSLEFQYYDNFIYPHERSGEWLEGPLSSEWKDMPNRKDKYELDKKDNRRKDSGDWIDPYQQRPKNSKKYGEY